VTDWLPQTDPFDNGVDMLRAGKLGEAAAAFAEAPEPWGVPLSIWVRARLAAFDADGDALALLREDAAAAASTKDAAGEDSHPLHWAVLVVDLELRDLSTSSVTLEQLRLDREAMDDAAGGPSIRGHAATWHLEALDLRENRDRDLDEALATIERAALADIDASAEGLGDADAVRAVRELWRCRLLIERRDWPRVREELAAALQNDSALDMTRFYSLYAERIGDDHHDRSAFEAKCRSLLDEAAEPPVRDPEARCEIQTELAAAIEDQHPDDALALYESALKTRSGDWFAVRGVARCSLLVGDIARARQVLDEAAQRRRDAGLDPDPDLRRELGNLEHELGHLDVALARYRQAVDLRPHDGLLIAEVARAQRDGGEGAAALDTMTKALEDKQLTRRGDVVTMYIDLLLMFDRSKDAARVLERERPCAEESTRIADRMAARRITLQGYRQWAGDPPIATDLGPMSSGYEVLIARGWHQLSKQTPLEAERTFERARRLRPYANEPMRGIAAALRALGRPSEAARRLASFRGGRPDHQRRRLDPDLGWALLDAGAADRAFQLFDASRQAPIGGSKISAQRGVLAAMAARGDPAAEIHRIGIEAVDGLETFSRSKDARGLAVRQQGDLLAELAGALVSRDDLALFEHVLHRLRELELPPQVRFKLSVKVSYALLRADRRGLARSVVDDIDESFLDDLDARLLRAELALADGDGAAVDDCFDGWDRPDLTSVRLTRARAAVLKSGTQHARLQVAAAILNAATTNPADGTAGAPDRDAVLEEARAGFAALVALGQLAPTFDQGSTAARKTLQGARDRCALSAHREPSRTFAARTAALLNAVLGEPVTALSTLDRLTVLVDRHEIAFDRGVVLIIAGRWKEACEQLQLAMDHDGLSRPGRALLGVCLQESGDPDAALREFSTVVRQQAADPFTRRSYAMTLAGAGRYDEALSVIDAGPAGRSTPDAVRTSLARSAILFRQAMAAAEPKARKRLLQLALVDASAARGLAASSNTSSYFEGVIAYTVGVIKANLGEREAAMQKLQAAAKANPPATDATSALAQIAESGDNRSDRLEGGGTILAWVGAAILGIAIVLGFTRMLHDPTSGTETSPTSTATTTTSDPTATTDASAPPATSAVEDPTTPTTAAPTEPTVTTAAPDTTGTTDTTVASSTTTTAEGGESGQGGPYAGFPDWTQIILIGTGGLLAIGVGIALPNMTKFKASEVEITLVDPDPDAGSGATAIALTATPLVSLDTLPIRVSAGIYRAPATDAGTGP
jgi:tetratricopeptide (TPR) repeat protein